MKDLLQYLQGAVEDALLDGKVKALDYIYHSTDGFVFTNEEFTEINSNKSQSFEDILLKLGLEITSIYQTEHKPSTLLALELQSAGILKQQTFADFENTAELIYSSRIKIEDIRNIEVQNIFTCLLTTTCGKLPGKDFAEAVALFKKMKDIMTSAEYHVSIDGQSIQLPIPRDEYSESKYLEYLCAKGILAGKDI